MIKWPITYTNFEDEEVTQDFYFHMSKKKLIDMVLKDGGGFDSGGGASGLVKHLTSVVESGDEGRLLDTFNNMIGDAFGLRDPNDANAFVQTDQLKAGFMNSPAFDALLMQLLNDEDAVTRFVTGIMPKDLRDHMDLKVTKTPSTPAVVSTGSGMPSKDEVNKLTGLKEPRDKTNELLAWAFREPTDEELTKMTRAQLLDVSRRQASGWAPKPL